MFLTPSDTEKLLLSVAGMVARDRLERGVRLNYPETVALLSCWVLERAREGGVTVERLMEDGARVLHSGQVMDGVPAMVEHVQAEATFPDGRKLVTLSHPVRSGPADDDTGGTAAEEPGALRVRAGAVTLNRGAERRTVVARNDGDRPVQVGSHFHLADVNRALVFFTDTGTDDGGGEPEPAPVDGFRLDIAAGTSVRFQPGDTKRLPIVALGGTGTVPGLQVRADRAGDNGETAR